MTENLKLLMVIDSILKVLGPNETALHFLRTFGCERNRNGLGLQTVLLVFLGFGITKDFMRDRRVKQEE